MNFIGWILILWVFSGFCAEKQGLPPQDLDDYVVISPSKKTVPIPSRAALIAQAAVAAQAQAEAYQLPASRGIRIHSRPGPYDQGQPAPLSRSFSFAVEGEDSSSDEELSSPPPLQPGAPSMAQSLLLAAERIPSPDIPPIPLFALPQMQLPEVKVEAKDDAKTRAQPQKRKLQIHTGRCCSLGLCGGSRAKKDRN